VLVIHENRGLNPHIQDVTRRVAAAGFTALGLDYLSPLGGTPSNQDEAIAKFAELKPEVVAASGKAAVAWLRRRRDGTGKVGAVGFCWGGGAVNDLAVAGLIDAGVVYYGRQPDSADVEKIEAPLLLHYAGEDTRINSGIAPFEEALKKAKKKYTLYVYDGVQHAFNNDTSEARYNEAAAKLAWTRTVEFLKANLAG